MKLFIIAALITVSTAARLEQLEQQKLRAYLPPSQRLPGASGGVKPIVTPVDEPEGEQPSLGSRGSFPSASTKYLPPDQGSTASSELPQFAGSLNGFQQIASLPLAGQETPAQLDATSLGTNPLGAQTSNEPETFEPHSSQNIPQQAFDEKTGYKY